MQWFNILADFVLHLDVHLTEIVQQYGLLTYGILFFIIFAETGFVLTPFLPGDSLLFAAGAISALGSIHIVVIVIILIIAATVGDTVNYWIGHYFGRKMVDNPKIPINQEHIDKTEQFFQKYGGKTILIARFIPIVRTFAPFVAGIGSMNYRYFITYNITGGVLWVSILTFTGYFFGNLPFIRKNFEYAIFFIIFLSLVPVLYEYIQHKRNGKQITVTQDKLRKAVNE